MTAQTPAQRAQATRVRRKAIGLVRHDVYCHPDDWPAIRERVNKLAARREKAANKGMGAPT